MVGACIAVGVSLLLALFSEFLWQKKYIKGEAARKFLHILIGTWTAFWPWLMSFHWIIAIALGGILFNLVSQRYKIFHAIYAIKRKSWGAYIVAFGVALTALFFQNKEVFALAILHLSLADGVAALVGKHFGKNNQYKILDGYKSWAGSGAFFVISATLQLGYYLVALRGTVLDGVFLSVIIPIAVIATMVEAVSIRGTDNLTIPLVVAGLLNVFIG